MKKLIGLFLLLFSSSFAQVGGSSTYQFLNVVSSPKVAALGGYALAVPETDLESVYFNPSLLSAEHSGQMDLNYTDYFSDINYGYVAYSKDKGNLGRFAAGIKYVHYGTFTQADEAGLILGEFSASETAAHVSWAKTYQNNWHYGVNLKLVYSNFFLYNSFGVLGDFALTYRKPKSNFTAAVVVKNIGTQIKPYTSGNYEPVPFELQIGVSQKLKHAPFRFSINAHHLNKALWFDSPNEASLANTSITGNSLEEESTGDKILTYMGYGLRHLTFGTELLLTKNFYAALAYNHQRREELKLREGSRSGMVGFSFGAGIKIKKFSINYGRSIYHLSGSTNHIGISTNFEAFKKQNKTEQKVD